ncbi:MAG: hypothetical protein HY831_01215 [Candidatus Aenigmarchaeota archaeon]|nr:hypothetical protein [Candidatus Aenigmarchaeota archaeon]
MVKRRNNTWLLPVMLIVVAVAFGSGFFLSNFLNPSKVIEKYIEVPINQTLSLSSSSTNVVAVSEDGSGILGKANIELVPGKGRILINTDPFIEADTQLSAETAIKYALNYTKVNIKNNDIIVSFNMTFTNASQADVVGGPSAGSALTVAAIAVLENKTVRNDISLTGTVELNGSIGKVGSVPEKAAAAGKAGMKIFLVPKDQAQITYSEKVSETEMSNGFEIKKIKYVQKTDSLNNYTLSQWNMTTIEVENVLDTLQYVFE